MSRWTDEFKNHELHQHWGEIKNCVEAIKPIKKSTREKIMEYARLCKIITYIDGLLKAVDPELVPRSVWDSFSTDAMNCFGQLESYKTDDDIGFIQNANDNLDEIIKCIAPYIASGKNAAQTAGMAFKAYTKTIDEQLELLKNDGKPVIDDISQMKEDAEKSKEAIQGFEKTLFEGDEEEDGLQERMQRLEDELKRWHKEISSYMVDLKGSEEQKDEDEDEDEDEDDEGQTSIMSRIENAEKEASEKRNAIAKALTTVTEEIKDLKDFYPTIFGQEQEDGKVVGGLKHELDTRLQHLTQYEIDQKEVIKSILHSATNADLAIAYTDLKTDSKERASDYTLGFIISLGFFLFMGFALFTDIFSIEFNDAGGSFAWLQNFISKFSILGGTLWLSLFLSKRRNEYHRLEQEYAHKEALAKSYSSFREQIENLDEKNSELAQQLLKTSIEAIGFNASKTLDKNHGDKMPPHEVIDNFLSGKDMSKLVEFFKQFRKQ